MVNGESQYPVDGLEVGCYHESEGQDCDIWDHWLPYDIFGQACAVGEEVIVHAPFIKGDCQSGETICTESRCPNWPHWNGQECRVGSACGWYPLPGEAVYWTGTWSASSNECVFCDNGKKVLLFGNTNWLAGCCPTYCLPPYDWSPEEIDPPICESGCDADPECDEFLPGQQGNCPSGQACSSDCQCIDIDCCPSVSISAPSKVSSGNTFTVELTYHHSDSNPLGGGVHLHWLNDKVEFISTSGCTCQYYDETLLNPDILQDNLLVECVPVYDGDKCTIKLKALTSNVFRLRYRAWDESKDAFCGGERYDYDRDPNSGTCSTNCDLFSDDVIRCNCRTKTINRGGGGGGCLPGMGKAEKCAMAW